MCVGGGGAEPACSDWLGSEGGGGVLRGGGCLFEGRYPLPNYRPRFSALSAPQSFLPPSIFECHRPPPPKIKHSKHKTIYKSNTKFTKQLIYKEFHLPNKMQGIQTYIIS